MRWFPNANGSGSKNKIPELVTLRRILMKITVIAIVILLLIALILGSMYVGRRNQMVVKREAVSASWAQVDVVLQRRADLIPNLVATVKGFAQHEEQVFSEIAAARANYLNAKTPADKISANGQLD